MEILILRNYTFLGVNCLVFSEKKLREIESLTLETNFTRLIQKKNTSGTLGFLTTKCNII